MELELGLKITKTRDDIDSISEYQFMKDTGPVFKSRETNTMFILTAHLKGYKRNNIDININKDGNKISIKGKKPIQEMVMMGWVMQKKVVDVKGFNKVFKIPYGVNLDKIKANYNEEEWMLNIVMPKLVKGVFGLKIEEIKEQEFDKGRREHGKSDFDHVSSSVGETSQKGSKEFEFQHMEGSDNIIEKMIDDTKKEINEGRMLKEVGEYKLRIEDGNGESVREKGGKEEYEVSKKLEIDQSVGIFMSKEIEDTSQDKEFEDQKLNSRSVDKRLDDVNKALIGSTIKKDNEESKFRIKDNRVKDASQIGFKESMIQQSGESKQNEFGEPKCESKVRLKESMEESSKEPFEAMKVPKHDENIVDHIPNNIDSINQTQLKEEYEKPTFEAYEDVQKTMFGDTIQKEIIKPNKEGFGAKITINEEFPKNLPKNNYEESEGLNNQKMQETKNEKEEMVGKEVEYFLEKGQGERLKVMHEEANKGNNTNETGGQQHVAKMKESKGCNVAKEEEQKEVKKEALVENGSLIVEGNESKEITKEIVQDGEDKIENDIVKLKGEGSTKMHVEPNEPFEGENVNNGIFDESETKMFHAIEQTKDVNEKGANIEHSKKKIQNEGIQESVKESSMKPFEANEDVHKDFGKPMMESKDGNQESAREKLNKEAVEGKINEEVQNYLPEITNEQNKGLNVQKRREIKDVKENVVKRNVNENVVKRKGKGIEYFVENGEGDRLKNMHVNKESEHEKSEHGIKESGQQHENTVKEMYEVSKSETKELPRQVAEIDGSKDFDVAKEEKKDEVLNEALVESESSMEMVQGEESNPMTKEIAQDDEDKIGIFDGRKTNKFREMKQTEDVKEKNAKIGKFAKTVNEKIQNEEDEDLKKNTTKEKDQCCLQEDMSEGRCESTKSGKEDFSMKMLDSQIDTREGPKDRKMKKTKGIKEESEKVKREKYKKLEVEANELQGTEIETISQILFEESVENKSKPKEIGTPEREFQSVASMGFKEFDYRNAKDKKQNMTMSPQKFQSKETHESKDESINQDILNQKIAKEVETIDDEVVKSLSTPKFQITQQSEVEEKDKSCEGSKEKYKVSLESKGQNHTKDIQNCIEMKENEEAKQKDTFKQEMPLEKGLKKGEKGEFLNGETMQEKEAEPLESSLKNDVAEMKTKRPLELEKTIVNWKFPKTKDQHDYGTEEMKLPKIAACQEANPSKLQRSKCNQQSTEKIKAIGEHEETKDSPKLNIVETAKIDSLQPQFLDVQENILQKKEEPKVTKIEEKHVSTLQREIRKTTQTTEEKELKMKEKMTPFEKVSGSKRVEEKVPDTPNRELQREIEEVASKMVEPSTTVERTPTKKGERKNPQELTGPNLNYEISKVEEVQKENEVESHIPVLEKTIYKEEGTKANEVESLEASLNNDNVQHEQHEFGTEEIKEPKEATYQEAKTSKLQRPKINEPSTDEISRKSEENIDSLLPLLLNEQDVLHVEEKNDKNGFHTPNIVEEERVVKKREGPMVAKNEETNNSSTLIRVNGKPKTKEENKPKMKEITTQFEKATRSKSVEEKVHQTPKREHQRELEEVTSKIKVEAQTTVEKNTIKEVERKEPLELTSLPNMVNEILKVEEKHQEKEGQKHIQVLEATVAKGKDDRGHQYVQKNNKKEFQTQKTLEDEKVVKEMEEAKVAKSEENKDDCTFKRQDGKTTQASKFDNASSESKRVGEKVHETSDRNHQRELEEATSKMRVEQPTIVVKTPTNMDNEIPRVKEFRKEEVERHIQELEATISKEKDIIEQKEDTGSQQNSMVPKNLPPKRDFDSMEDTPTLEVVADKVVQQLEVPSTSCTKQFGVEGEEKAKRMEPKIDVHDSKKCKRGQDIEQCINNDEEAKQGIEEIKDEEKDYEQVFEEKKEGEDEKRGGKKDNAKISKEFFVPLVIAGSAILVTLIAIFVRNRRARKR
ncbi:unnamed protein product [Trifolium pratense]|uniref:Uncharacterized protein n=1 Tax=Trifolium pratense TaxID=57577 RepID=A0ACB0LDS0_TRIPR|nr:unnamed protein product [Trifolium pratense]